MARTPDMFDEASDAIRSIEVVHRDLVTALRPELSSATLDLVLPLRCGFRLPFAPWRYSFGVRYSLKHRPTPSAEVLSLIDAAFREAGLEPTVDEDGQPIVGRAHSVSGNVMFGTSAPRVRDEISTTVDLRAISVCMRLPRGYDNVIELQDDWEERLGYTSGPSHLN